MLRELVFTFFCLNAAAYWSLAPPSARLGLGHRHRLQAKEREKEKEQQQPDLAAMKRFMDALNAEKKESSYRGKGKLLDPSDFPELLSDLPGYEVEEVVKETSSEYIPIFDDPVGVNKMYGGSDDPFSISSDSLRDISDAYDFSLSYLGDLVVQMGASTPIDIDIPVSSYLTGEQIYTLLQSVNSLDPSEVGLEYGDSLSARELCEQTGLSPAKMESICSAEGLNLPFGLDSMLHVSVVERVLAAMNDDGELDDEGERGEEGDGEDDGEDDDEGEVRRTLTDEDKNIW